MMGLIQNIADQRHPQMPTSHRYRQFSPQGASIRRLPPLQPITRVVSPDHQILHYNVTVALEARPLGHRFSRRNHLLFVNHQRPRLAPLLRPRPFACRIRAGRVAFRYVSPLSPPNRTCTFQHIRLSRDWLPLPGLSLGLSSHSRSQPAPFGSSHTIPGAIAVIRYPETSISCGPSPCGWLSRPPTTMAAPTLIPVIGGLLTFPSRYKPPTFTTVDSAR